MVFVGNIAKSGIIYNLMKKRTNVEDFKEALVAEDFGLTSLPEELWRPHLELPEAAVVSAVATRETGEEVAGE